MLGNKQAKTFTKKLYATTVLAASVLTLSTPAYAGGISIASSPTINYPTGTTTIPVTTTIPTITVSSSDITPGIRPITAINPVAPPVIPPVVDGQFVSGSGSFTQTPNQTTITVDTTRSIINFPEYNIGTGQEVHYQSNVGDAVNLSRVTGGDPSKIYGTLSSTGVTVYLINPNGIEMGPGAKVDVPNLIMSTTGITNENFNKGNLVFDVKGKSDAKIINNGSITVSDAGLAALVAPTVENNGVITAKHGKVALAGGEAFTLDMYGDDLVKFAVSDSENSHLVKQSGKIAADGGVVFLTTQDANKVVNNVVNLDGVVEANAVKIHGDTISLGDASEINTSSATSGGKVSIQGKKISIAKNAKINSNALVSGNGGDVNIQASNELNLNGTISAKGAGTGNGGTVETSGDQITLGYDLLVTTLDQKGGAGTWLMDPTDFTIDSSFGTSANHINNIALSLLLGFNNITLSSTHDVNVNNSVLKVFGPTTTLTLQAANDINLKSGVEIGATTGKLNVNLDANNAVNLYGSVITNGGYFNVANQAGTGDAAQFNLETGSSLVTGAGKVKIGATTSNLDSFIGTDLANISGDSTTVNVISNKANISQGAAISKTGGTVNIGAGTYFQYVDITKDVTLNGAGAGSTIIKGQPLAAANIYNGYTNGTFKDFYDATNNSAIVLVQNANANINGITVDGTGQHASAGSRVVGIGFDNAGGNVTASTIQNVDAGIVAQANLSIFSVYDQIPRTLTLTGSTIQNFASNGVLANGNLLTVNLGGNGGNFIKGNNTATNGIFAGRGTAGEIDNTTFLGFGLTGASEISVDSVADGFKILANNMAYGQGNTYGISANKSNGLIIENNTIYGNYRGINATNSDNLLIGSDDISNNYVGVAITDSKNAIINNSKINSNAFGVALSGSDNALVQSSDISYNQDDGINATASNGLQVHNITFTGNAGNGVVVTASDSTQIIDSQFDGLGYGFTGVYLNGSTNAVISSDTIKNEQVGARLINSDNGIINNTTITGSVNYANNGGGYGVIVSGGNNVLVQSSQINNNAIDGLLAQSTTGLNLNNVTLANNLSNGVELNNSNNTTITNSQINNNGNEGVIATASNGLQITNSKILNNLYVGLDLVNSNNAKVTNTEFANDGYGIYAETSNGLNVSGSNIHNNNQVGIALYGSQNANLSNDIIASNYYGVMAGTENVNSSGLTIDGSTISGNTYGVETYKADNLQISNSTFNNNSDGVYLTYTDGAKFTNDSFNNNNIGLSLSGSKNTSVADSHFTGNTSGGLEATMDNPYLANQVTSDGLTVTGSTFAGNGIGVYMYGGVNNSVAGSTFSGNGTAVDLRQASTQVSGDTLTNNTYGIYLNGASTATISNTAINGGTEGVYAYGNGATVAFNGTNNSFAGQSDQYITLTGGAMAGQDLSVKGVSFDGIVANDSTSDTDSFKIEDKIHHEMDENAVGLVTWKDNNVYATHNNLGIQQGINVSNAGGTVNITSGTFNEALDINKGITLIGRGKGTDASVDTIINGGAGDAVNGAGIYVHAGDSAVSLNDVTLTTNGAQYGVLVDGTQYQTIQSGITIPGIGFVPNGPLIILGSTTGALDFSMNNVLFNGTQSTAALQFQNATLMRGATSSGVEFRSTAANGWRFLNITGDAPKNSVNTLAGDMDFGNTVFQNTYGQDIRLTNTTMDGYAVNVTFEGTTNPFEIENKVYHVFDSNPLGMIFYNGFNLVQEASNLGSFQSELAQDVGDVYYNSVSAAGRIYDSPSIRRSARVKTFNPTNDTKISISAASPSVINLPTASAAQIAGLAPASGNSQQAESRAAGQNELKIAALSLGQSPNPTPKQGLLPNANGNQLASALEASQKRLKNGALGNNLNDIETGSGTTAQASNDKSAADLNNLDTAAGGLPRQLAANCSVSFGNSFLADDIKTVSGACQ